MVFTSVNPRAKRGRSTSPAWDV